MQVKFCTDGDKIVFICAIILALEGINYSVLNSYLSVKTKAQTIVITKKHALKRSGN